MHQTSDLQRALDFVIRRIEEEGMRSGEPLTDEQRFLLRHLPTEPVLSEAYFGDPNLRHRLRPETWIMKGSAS